MKGDHSTIIKSHDVSYGRPGGFLRQYADDEEAAEGEDKEGDEQGEDDELMNITMKVYEYKAL